MVHIQYIRTGIQGAPLARSCYTGTSPTIWQVQNEGENRSGRGISRLKNVYRDTIALLGASVYKELLIHTLVSVEEAGT